MTSSFNHFIVPDAPPPPIPVMDDIGALSATVRWNPVPLRLANGQIMNYIVNYRIAELTTTDSSRKKRQIVDDMLVQECITGGIENVNRNLTVDGDQTTATLENLSKMINIHSECELVPPIMIVCSS